MDREKILLKIRNMIERTQHNGCSEAESLEAAKKVGELMNKYDVSMNEVQFAGQEFDTLDIKLNSKRTDYMSHVIQAIGKFTDTKVWMARWSNADSYSRYRKYCFFGTKKDIMIAEYIYKVINNAIETELKEFKKSTDYKKSTVGGRTKVANFISGITNRLSRRLEDMKEEIEEENSVNSSVNESSSDDNIEETTERSLIVYDKFEIVEKKFKEKLDIKLKNTYSYRGVKDKSAYQSGIDAGNNVNIRKAVGSAKGNGQKLIG